MMLHSTASATAAGKVEADVLLTFQIIPLIPIWDLCCSIWRECPVRIHPRRQNRKIDPTWKSGSVMRASSTKAFPLPPSHGAFLSSFPLARLGCVWHDTAIFYESGLWHWKHGGCLHSSQVAAVDTCGLCSLWSAAARWRHRAPLYSADGELMPHSSTDRPQLWTAKWLIGETQVDVGHSR